MSIVVALSKSERRTRIMDFAVEEAKFRNEKLIIVHSLFGGSRTSEEEITEGESLLKWAEEKAKAEGIDVETHLLVRGKEAGDDIIDFIREVKPKMVIVGVRRRSPTGKVIFGSVPQKIILNSDVPVVSIR
ncbi:Universal stress protein UspA-related nucleotide-binding protein [Archaeoglobus sulfaticallidus PM70-1]|uniref:Universal stress protein UspA-related nucleotide-binding protein n=1 Tax=Archaeoglobus sulfaticallidus PM70-1 TaxID=387631 RepID=N0BDK9_9EURY|nr:universal stress protein [Archaeoglobus sulfaticallidus]AGK61083.1 Universal stress protein UspA-related nucleotide-binding protein [Archaeoglobus sulfaticallidus PM70-1]